MPGAETPPRPLHLWLSEGDSSDLFPTPPPLTSAPAKEAMQKAQEDNQILQAGP